MKLHYFNVRARGEPIRAALTVAGVPFEDHRIKNEDWPALKASGKFELGQLPALELADGTQLVQSLAILRYVGRTNNLYPQDADQAYIVDSTLETIKDFGEAVVKNFFNQDEEAKKAGTVEILTNTFPRFAKVINERLVKNGQKHFIAGA